MPYLYDGMGEYPELSAMVEQALQVLGQDEEEFFLMVESGRIDHAAHDNDLFRALYEVQALAQAVDAAMTWAEDRNDTLIVVTADHETGGLNPQLEIALNSLPAAEESIWAATGHTGVTVPLYAEGKTSEYFSAQEIDNTDIFYTIVDTF